MQFITAPMLRMPAEVAESRRHGCPWMLTTVAIADRRGQTRVEFDVQAANHLRSLEGRAKEGRD
jgi:hypothetical protein